MDESKWLRWRAQAFLTAKGIIQRTTLGARGLLIDGEQVLLLRHTYVPGWQLPGGGVDPGESAEDAFRREMVEETGYRPIGGELFGLYHNIQATNRDHVALFVAREFEQARVFRPNREIAEIGWFRRDSLPEATTESTRQRLGEVFGGAARRINW